MYRIFITPQAKRELKAIAKLYRGAITEAINDLKEDPLIGKPLSRELTKKFSYRVGVYRIVYKIYPQDKKVHILTVGHRSVAYN